MMCVTWETDDALPRRRIVHASDRCPHGLILESHADLDVMAPDGARDRLVALMHQQMCLSDAGCQTHGAGVP